MDDKKLIEALLSLSVETGSLVCLGCGHEHNCSIHGCAILRQAAEQFLNLQQRFDEVNDFTKSQCSKMLERLAEKDKQITAAGEAMHARSPDNKALTVEELREMDGQPVWIVSHPDWGHWELSERAEDYFEDMDEDFYGMTMPPALPDPMGRYGLHMLGWLAYRRPPEKGE